MKVAVTGAGGFVGRYLVHYLLERGHQVVALSRKPYQWRSCTNAQPEYHVTDYDRRDLAAALVGVDALVHLTAMRTNLESDALGMQPYYDANVRTTENIFLAACDLAIPRICQASSVAVYSPDNTLPYGEGQRPVPLSFYGASKLACENLAVLYARRFPVKIISLRLAQMFGFGEARGLSLTKFFEQARHKQALTVWGSGSSAKDYLYVKDAVVAIERVLTVDTRRDVFNIGSGVAYSVLEIAETINSVFKNPFPIEHDFSKPDVTTVSFMDVAAARDDLGWRPEWSLRAAVEDMCICCDREDVYVA